MYSDYYVFLNHGLFKTTQKLITYQYRNNGLVFFCKINETTKKSIDI